MKKFLGIIILSFLCTSLSFAKIIIPTHNWSSQIVGAYVIGGIFEELGYPVKYKNTDSQAVYESIRKGKVSISHEVWESAFGGSFNNALARGGIVDAGEHVARSMEDMGVPNWVIEKNLCPGLPDWTALKNPACAKNFITANSGGKGQMLEGPQAWHGDLIPQRIDALGLGDLWTVVYAGSADALWSELYNAERKGRGTIIFNWSPNWTDRRGFTMINFPPYYPGCRPGDGGNGKCGSPDGYIKKAASSKFIKQYPEAFAVLKKINFTTLDIGSMAALVDVDKMTHEAAAKKWLRDNRYKWEYWIGRTNIVYDANKQQEIDQKYPKTRIAKKPDNSNDEKARIDEEKRKIEEEKRKIEEEKRKIADAKKKQKKKKEKETEPKLFVIGSGTGFFVSADGHAVSNDHVIGICEKLASKIQGKIVYFDIITTDKKNDLGLFKGDYRSQNYLSIKSGGAEFGEDIVAFGYPLSRELSSSVKLTRGIVSALSGPGNNYSEIQIDAAIQPGNSGGPVLNMEGQVVGVASSGLNKLFMLKESEYIPENVNFAVAATTLSNFLKANGVRTINRSYRIKNTKELAKIGRPATLQLFCLNTKAVYEELKRQKKHSDVLLEKVRELR